MESAIHAGSDSIFRSHKKLQDKPEVKETQDRKVRLSRLHKSKDFQEIVKMIDVWIAHLQKAPMVSSDDTVEAIGYRYLASSLTIEYLEQIKSVTKRCSDLEKLKDEKRESKQS